MHIKSLRDAIAATVQECAAPRWITPALSLFSAALGNQGRGFDILYAVVKGKWPLIPDFWYTTLRLWYELHTSHGTTNWQQFSQTAPFWNNFHLLFGKTKRPLAKISKNNQLLQAHGFSRQQDFVDSSGAYATREFLHTLLDVDDFERPASKTLFINQVVPRLNLLAPTEQPFHGPHLPNFIVSALHEWSFDNKLVIDMENKDFVQLLLKTKSTSSIPSLPLDQLNVADFTPTDDLWKYELSLDRHLLPVCTDLKYRLQHNALGFRYKFCWRTEVVTSTTCIHGCAAVEDANHLFWTCFVAKHQWDHFLRPFRGLVLDGFDWSMILFSDAIHLQPRTIEHFGSYAVQVMLTIIRCCVLRAIWLHRNKRLYNPEVSTSSQHVQYHASAYIRMHIQQFRDYAETKGRKKWIQVVDYVSSCFQDFIGYSTVSTTDTT